MSLTTAQEGSVESHTLETNFTLLSNSQRTLISTQLQKHVQEITLIVHKLIKSAKLEYSNSNTFLKEFELKLPLVHWEISEHAPGEVIVYLLSRTLKRYDLSQFFSEMVIRWLIPWGQASIASTKQMSFSFSDFPKKTYFVSEIICHVEDEAALLAIREKMPLLAQEVALGAVSTHHARHILAAKGLTQEQKTTQLHKMIIELSNRKLKALGPDIFFEMHHFLLACDDEFKRIRDVKHMCRVICCHNWFRRLLRTTQRHGEIKERQIRFKLLKTPLHFTFGEKKVLGLVIAVNPLSEYEQFEAKHILRACQRLITHVRVVPHSFFCYDSPSDSVHSFYLEIEKKDGLDFTQEETKILKNGLGNELSLSIEQLSHKLFMPHNEEEVLRNILLLSQELRTAKDTPQIIISFRAQSETTLTFHVTLVRIFVDAVTIPMEKLFQDSSDLITFITGSKKIVGHIRNKHQKEANTFLLECAKAPFLRQDHSVDLLRAREFVLSCSRKIIGEIRDFNGGLICQQNQLLCSLKDLLSPSEMKHELHLENLFHSIAPILMKSLLAPELIRCLFQLFLELSKEIDEDTELRYKELRLDHALCFMMRTEDKAIIEDLQKSVGLLQFKDLEIANSNFKVGNAFYQGYILVPQETETLDKFANHLYEKIVLYSRSKNLGQTLRISLPRPTSLLDPRIGTDRTSGIVIKMLYEGLMRIDSNGKASFAIAERVSVSSDQKTYTFNLRPSKWSNGKPVTAYDFEYAWKKALDPNFKSLFSYLLYPIKNAKAVKKGQKTIDELGIWAKDSHTFSVELEHPAPYFLELTAHWIYSPLCKEIDELHPGWAYYGGENFVCNGPFKLAKWKRNSEIQAIKNPEYWDAEFVHLRKIDISIIENAKDALVQYQKDEIDWIGEPLSEIPHEAFKKKHFDEKIHSHPIAAVHWYDCNVKVAPFKSKKCRQALAIALNRQQLIDELLQGGEEPAYSILPPNLSLSKTPPFQDGDLELAKRLFQEGLDEQNITLNELTHLTISCCDQEIHEAIAQAVSKQWKEVLGLNMQVKTFKWDHFMQKCLQYDFHVTGTTWYSWFNDPLYNLEHMKLEMDEMNATQWQNQTYTELLDSAEVCLDLKERKRLLREAEMLIMDEMPIIPVFYYTFKYMKKEHVNNIFLSHLGQIDFKWAYINKPK
jgi:oligopeptide transport system substrate-binding protein